MAGYNYMDGGYYTNDPNKGSYGGIECSDHVCRPVIVDAEGRKRPIIAYTPSSIPESYIAASAERVVEHVHSPVVVTEYQYVSQAKVDPMRDYGVPADKWRRPSSPVRDRPQVMVTEYGYSSPITEVEPAKYYGVTGDKWHRPSSPVRGAGYDYGYSSPIKVEPVKVTGRDHPSEVEEFITKVQTEASRPARPSVLSGTNWRNRPNSTGQGGNPGYGEYGNNNNSDTYTEVIDSREAARRYGNFNPTSRPFKTGETYTGTIDSREAARKYMGSALV